MTKLIGIVGWKNSGKTTLIERLVARFAGEGLRVATNKHAHHDFDIDHSGKDSWRHWNFSQYVATDRDDRSPFHTAVMPRSRRSTRSCHTSSRSPVRATRA